MKKYVSISEYSKVVGVSTTAIYKSKSLQSYITTYNGVKSVNIGEMAKSKDEKYRTIANLFETPIPTTNKGQTDTTAEYIGSLKETIQYLKEQITQKDMEIERLTQLANNAQQLQFHAQKMLEPPKKKGIFSDWFNSRANDYAEPQGNNNEQ